MTVPTRREVEEGLAELVRLTPAEIAQAIAEAMVHVDAAGLCCIAEAWAARNRDLVMTDSAGSLRAWSAMYALVAVYRFCPLENEIAHRTLTNIDSSRERMTALALELAAARRKLLANEPCRAAALDAEIVRALFGDSGVA